MASPHHKARENVPCGPPAFSAASFVISFFLKKVFQSVKKCVKESWTKPTSYEALQMTNQI